jgi:hypothetical protein
MCAHQADDALTRLRRQAALLPDYQVPCRARRADGSSMADEWYSKHKDVLLRAQRQCLGALGWPCPLLLLCRQAAREGREEHGVWGGETPGERRKMLRRAKDIPAPREDTHDGTLQEEPPPAAATG